MTNFWAYYIREVWANRLGDCARVALFGAGEHSGWLLDAVDSAGGAEVVVLIDDRAEQIREFKGRPVVTPDKADPSGFDAVVISSDANEAKLFERARQCLPNTRVVRLYDGLPSGPYEKHGDLPAGIDTVASPAEAINLDTVVAVAREVETKEGLMEIFSKLDPDLFFDRLVQGYRRAIERYGRRWRYVDLWSLLYAYASVTRPQRYLEIGTRRGHSLAVVCGAVGVEAAATELEVVACDLWVENYAGSDNPGPQFVTEQLARIGYTRSVRFLSGSSHELLPEFLRGGAEKFDLITVDGDHSRDGALADLNTVAGALRLGGLLAFDDINHPQHPYLYEVWNTAMANRRELETLVNRRDGTGIAAGIRFR
ncbi:MAG TPA: class I SAM-dependent methyltransferase [Phycisphaerae bacterium]|nr:class I SAM-dependent methyltransferase [Phycisphaerae bacterium]